MLNRLDSTVYSFGHLEVLWTAGSHLDSGDSLESFGQLEVIWTAWSHLDSGESIGQQGVIWTAWSHVVSVGWKKNVFQGLRDYLKYSIIL